MNKWMWSQQNHCDDARVSVEIEPVLSPQFLFLCTSRCIDVVQSPVVLCCSFLLYTLCFPSGHDTVAVVVGCIKMVCWVLDFIWECCDLLQFAKKDWHGTVCDFVWWSDLWPVVLRKLLSRKLLSLEILHILLWRDRHLRTHCNGRHFIFWWLICAPYQCLYCC